LPTPTAKFAAAFLKQEAYLACFDAHDIRQEAERIAQKELN
jgi:hypothetical protein